jgi:catechol 2,3-dioxygenase-like lactoylglutathione lyase family enzyme
MHMGHVALRVPDIDAYVAHITDSIGLQLIERGEGIAYLATQTVRHELQLIQGDGPAFDHLGLMLDGLDELDAAVASAVGAGGNVMADSSAEFGCRRSVTIVGPGGVVHELYVPTARPAVTVTGFLDGRIRRLGHLTFLSADADALVAFWRDGLGFRLSDAATGFTWMRCDTHHHTLAVGPHPATTMLHHHAWEIQDVSTLTRHCDRNGAAGRPQTWGPVRHGPGFNIATYMPDAAGALIEVYSDLLTIDDDANYEPSDWSEEPLALNLWGTMPSPEFLSQGLPVDAAPEAMGRTEIQATSA